MLASQRAVALRSLGHPPKAQAAQAALASAPRRTHSSLRRAPQRVALRTNASVMSSESNPFEGRTPKPAPTGPVFAVERSINVLLVESVVRVVAPLPFIRSALKPGGAAPKSRH